jgi:hypothetical protein
MTMDSWDTVLGDVDDAILRHKEDGIPLFLMGHSMVGRSSSYLDNTFKQKLNIGNSYPWITILGRWHYTFLPDTRRSI